MQLDDDQLAEFEERGYLLFPGLLDGDEVAVLQKAIPEILSREGPEVVREKEDPTAARLAFGAHVYSEPVGYPLHSGTPYGLWPRGSGTGM